MKRFEMGAPALVVACIALFVALSGGAVAAVVVPMAKRAITAETALNAKKLGGETPKQIKASLRGVPGAAGATGPQGPQGAQGQQGPQGSEGPQGAVGPQGPAGPEGEAGAGLAIVGSAESAAELPASGTTGDGYLVEGDLFVWDGAAWVDAGPVRGPQGEAGPAGPAGATGPAGPQGLPGTAAVTTETQAFTLGAEEDGEFTAKCAAGKKAVSGGYTSDGEVWSLDTAPTAQGDGWTIFLMNFGDTATGSVYVICLG